MILKTTLINNVQKKEKKKSFKKIIILNEIGIYSLYLF